MSPTASQHTLTSLLDTHLNGIREEFDCVNKELDDARKQRDEYEANYRIQAKELRELKKILSHRAKDRDRITCRHCKGEIAHTCGVTVDTSSPLLSPASSYHSFVEEEGATSSRLDNTQNSNQLGQSDGETSTTTSERSVSFESKATPVNEPEDSAWRVEVNSDAETALNLSLLRQFTLEDVACVTFSMDGKLLATLSLTGIVRIFDVETGKRVSVMRDLYERPRWNIYYCLGVGPDSKYLATGSDDGQVRVWIISKRRIRNIFKHEWLVVKLDFSPDGQSIVACSTDGTVKIWRLRDGFSRVLIGMISPWAIRFSPDGRYIASGNRFGTILVWNVRTGQSTSLQGHHHGVNSLVFTPDSQYLLSGSRDKMVIRDVSSLRSLGTQVADRKDGEEADATNNSRVTEISRLVGHKYEVSSLSISPDGRWIAFGSWDRIVRIWNTHDSSLQRILQCRGSVCSADFSPVGNYLATRDGMGRVTIWNYADLECRSEFRLPETSRI